MKRKFLLLSFLLIVVAMLSGCADMEMGLTINGDNSGDLYIQSVFDSKLLDMDSTVEDFFTADELVEVENKLDLIQLSKEDVEYYKNDILYKGNKYNFKFKDINKIFSPEDQLFTLTDLGDGIYRMSLKFKAYNSQNESNDTDGINFSTEEYMNYLLEVGSKYEFIFDTEYKILSHNANYINSKGQLVWNLLESTLGLNDREIIVEYYTGNRDLVRTENKLRSRFERKLDFEKDHRDFHGLALNSLDILKGNGEDLYLDRELTRIEGILIYSRLLGLEDEILSFADENPDYESSFLDIPLWAKPVINYLSHEGLVHGKTHNRFGSDDLMLEEEFTTLILRALGYDDSKGGFTWQRANTKALTLGIYDNDPIRYEDAVARKFDRRSMSYIAYNALFFRKDNGGSMLIEDIVE